MNPEGNLLGRPTGIDWYKFRDMNEEVLNSKCDSKGLFSRKTVDVDGQYRGTNYSAIQYISKNSKRTIEDIINVAKANSSRSNYEKV